MAPRQRVVLVALAAFVVLVSFFSSGEAGTEFLTWSIDCGSDHDYTDEATGIPWVTDETFIKTGKNARNVTIYQSNEAYVNREQLRTLRYFDDSRSRHCYVLPVKTRTTYLLRLTFFLGNLTDSTKKDIAFSVHINATRWLRWKFNPDSDFNKTRSEEAIIYSLGAVLNICLLKSSTAVAFISTLELREFRGGMYSSVAAARGYRYQHLQKRINAGVTPAADNEPLSYLRYPDDPYDRLWWSPGSWSKALRITNTRRSSSSVDMPNQPPDIVMDDAWTGDPPETIEFLYSNTYPIGSMVTYCYVMEFDNNVTSITYSVDGFFIDTFNASSVSQQIVSSITVPVKDFNMSFTPNNTTSPAVLNAFEAYVLYDMDTSFTALADVSAVTNLQQALNMVDWSGDPCLPSPYDWLNCESDDERFNQYSPVEYGVRGLYLVNATTKATDKNAFAEINSFTNLFNLSLEDNGLREGSINLSRLTKLVILNVANNNFSGDVAEFVRSAGIRSNVQALYIGGNQFSSFSRKQSSPLFGNLTKLNLSDNRIEGNVMDFLASIGENNLGELYAANNLLGGRFVFDFNFPLPSIQILDLDNQNITGTLDLRNWSPFRSGGLDILIKLRNNNIGNVYPPLDALSRYIKDEWYNKQIHISGDTSYTIPSTILLSGNPWCRVMDNRTLAHQYLCRKNESEPVPFEDDGLHSDKKKRAEIGGISAAAGVLVICGIVSFVYMSRKLRRKSAALAEIQGALTKQKVHPPLYSYAELRIATQNFVHDNNLGQGAYGAVYRGKLTDGTQIAVKKLFNKDHQVLAEFLNEAVLITGIKHRNLAQLKGCCIDQEDQRILVYEYAERGNLAEALWGQSGSLKKRKPMNWKRRLNICVGIARGLSYLHEELQPRIIHRDIKPANILIDGHFNAKIADFGLARSLLDEQTRADYTRVAGTFGYLAPEYVTQGQLTEKADIFSCGVVFLEIVSGRKCIDQSFPPEKVSLIHLAATLRRTGNVMDILDTSIQSTCNHEEALRIIDIAFSCLYIEPSQRPTMSQVVMMLQGNASPFNHPPPVLDSLSDSIREDFSQIRRGLSLASASSPLDGSDQRAFLPDNTNRSDSQEMSSVSNR